MEVYPELTERIFREGHEIGLHGYTHNAMQTMCRTEVTMEIEKGMELLPDGCEVAFMRSPGGLYSKCVVSAAADQGLSLLHWSVDPQDWATHDAQAIEKEVLDHVRDGDVILLHDMSDSSVEAALMIVDALQEQGYQFVTASELARAKGVPLIPGTKYSRFTG
jgi:peptidoglycan/xylan/chitin deacetylase (PgdA/CDA1 family)